MVEKEEWKTVNGFDGLYLISSHGRVTNISKKWKKHGGRIVSGNPNNCGYLRVTLFKDGVRKTMPIHRLVIEHFSDAPAMGRHCNHKNGIKTDNKISNLEWVTPKQNSQHAASMGLYKTTKRLSRYTPTKEEVEVIRFFYSKGSYGNTKALAQIYGVTTKCIRQIGSFKRRGSG